MNRGVRWCGILLGALLLSAPAFAQFPPGGGAGQGGLGPPPQKPEKKKRPSGPRIPLPEPLGPDVEEARERAKKPGVLLGSSPQAGRIYQIRVQGARKIEPDAVLVYIHSRVDTEPSQKVFRSDVRRIYRMGLFQDVVIKTLPGPKDSVIVIYDLQEKPAIGNVLIDDNDEVGDDDIREVIDLKAFQVLDIPRVQRNIKKIEKLYVDKGYFLAEVTYEIKPSDGPDNPDGDDEDNLLDNVREFLRNEGINFDWLNPSDDDATKAEGEGVGEFADIVFKIVEHDKVKVDQIRFVGNDNLSEAKLKGGIGTKEDHPLGFFTDWGTYKEEMAELDPLAAEAIYQDEGYITVKVGQPRVALSADKTKLTLSIPVTEGKQYRLRSFDISGDLVVEDREEYDRIRDEEPDRVVFLKSDLLRETSIKKDQLFARSKVAQDVINIADRYRDRGYAFVNINPLTSVHDEDDTVELALAIDAGPRVRIERVEVTGNSKTQDRVIRRELRVYEGEFYNATLLKRSEQRVTALGFFENVEVTTRQGTRPDRMVVIFDVTEKSTGTFQVGAGFSNAEQFILTGQISQNNFIGRGVTLSGSIQWSSFRQIIDFRYVDPYAFYIPVFGQYEPVTLAFSLFNTQRNFIDFFRNSAGADVTMGYPIGRPFRQYMTGLFEASPDWLLPYVPDPENLQLFMTANGERVEIQEGSFNVRLLGLAANIPRYTSSLRGSMIFDQRNNRLFPSAGYYLSLGAEFAHPWLGSALAPPAETFAKGLLDTAGIRDGLGPVRPGILKTGGIVNNFRRYSINARAYYSLNELLPLDGVVLKANVELGFIDTDDDSLIFERYYLGGFNTIRGYFPRSIGPVQRVGSLSPDGGLREFRVGGTKQLFTNIELEFPIFEQVGIRGVLFADFGNAYGPDENFFYIGNEPTPFLQTIRCGGKRCWDPRDRRDLPLGVYTAVGAGIRWFSPIGPLRFEWGVPLNARPIGTFGFTQGDQPVQFEFNIGQSF